jgi:hypothetical protein
MKHFYKIFDFGKKKKNLTWLMNIIMNEDGYHDLKKRFIHLNFEAIDKKKN